MDVTRLLIFVVMLSLLTILLLTNAELILTISSLGVDSAGRDVTDVTPGALRLSTALTAGNYQDNGHLRGPNAPESEADTNDYDEEMSVLS